jgi:hypothetical protein
MKLAIAVLSLCLMAGVCAFFVLRHADGARAESTDPSQPVRPVVVELFTSEGCSSCPPADALLAKLDQQRRLGNAEIIPLEEHVDYWDQLGWRDPFSSSQWTERQQEYMSSLGTEGVYTPQMVVDGQTEFVGSLASKAHIAISEASQQPKADVVLAVENPVPYQVRLKIDVKMLPSPEKRDAGVWLAVTESGLHSNVQRGENAGEDLHHAAVVRSLRKVGTAKANESAAYSGEQEVRLDSAWKPGNVRLVVFVQDVKSRHIFGAASVYMIP